MGPEASVLGITAGGGVLALWLYVRCVARRPRTMRGAVAHAVAAATALSLMPPVIGAIIGDEPSVPEGVATLVGMLLPALTYMFLASLYVMEHLQRRLYTR